jgi:hypothetical protein
MQGDQVVLNYLPLVNQAAVRIGDDQPAGQALLTLPEIADMIPAEAIRNWTARWASRCPPTSAPSSSSTPTSAEAAVRSEHRRQGLLRTGGAVLPVDGGAIGSRPASTHDPAAGGRVAVVTVIERRIGISSVDSVVNIAKPENQAAVGRSPGDHRVVP